MGQCLCIDVNKIFVPDNENSGQLCQKIENSCWDWLGGIINSQESINRFGLFRFGNISRICLRFKPEGRFLKISLATGKNLS